MTTAQTIVVTPSEARPGQQVHISVPECGVGTTAHSATSPAFAHDVALFGKSDTGDADPVLRKDLKPGTYPITAHCGAAQTVQGQVLVAGPSGGPGGGSNASYWLLGAVILAVGVGAWLLRKRL